MKSAPVTKILACLLLLVLIVSLVPLLALAPYDVPQNDDFFFGQYTHPVWESTRSVSATLKQAAGFTVREYTRWQGTYAAIFLMSLQPGIWGIDSYAATPFILLFSLLFGLAAFIRALGRHVLGCTFSERLILFSLAALLCTQLLPSPLQGYYWYNGAIFYTFFFALMLVFLALLIAFLRRDLGRRRNLCYYILLPLLAAVLAGGNYSTGLVLAMLLLAVVVWQFAAGRRNPLPLIVLLLFLALFALNLLAPGNAQHQSQPGGLFTAVKAGVKAILKALRSIVAWTSLPMLAALAAGAPIAWRFAGRTAFRFRFPWLVMLASFLLLAAGFMPTLYTQDYTGSDRLLDMQFYTHTLLLFLNLFYCVGWLRRRLPDQALAGIAPRAARGMAAVIAVLALAVCAGSYDSYASFDAARSLVSGEAAAYKAEADARFRILEDPAVTDVVFQPLKNRPALLSLGDFGTNPRNWINIIVGEFYYGKNSLVLEGEARP